MVTPPESDGQRSGGRSGRSGGTPVLRALVVLLAFVLVTVLVLAEIHPSSTSGSNPTTTTVPRSSTHTTPTTTTIPPAKVAVVVANGSGVNGAAGAVTDELKPGGWNLLPPTDASAEVTASQVYYVAGYERPAAAVASSLALPASSVRPYTTAAPISSLGAATVAVVVGPDLADKTGTTTTTTTAG